MNEETLHPQEGPGARRPARARAAMTLDELFLSRYTVLRFENQGDFHQMLLEMKAAWEPGNRAEELTVLRMAQTAWALRRVDTMETAFQETLVERARKRNPNAHAAASLVFAFYGRKGSAERDFAERIQGYRALHEATLERQTRQLLRLKEHREASELRALRAERLRAETLAWTGQAPRGGEAPTWLGGLSRVDQQVMKREGGAERDADAGNSAVR